MKHAIGENVKPFTGTIKNTIAFSRNPNRSRIPRASLYAATVLGDFRKTYLNGKRKPPKRVRRRVDGLKYGTRSRRTTDNRITRSMIGQRSYRLITSGRGKIGNGSWEGWMTVNKITVLKLWTGFWKSKRLRVFR